MSTGYKAKSDSYLMKMTKAEITEELREAECELSSLEEKAVSDEVYGNDSRDNVYFYMNEFLENVYSVSELIDILADVAREHEEEYGDDDV